MKQKKFGVGHIVPGTIAIFESPRLKSAPEDAKKYPGQHFQVFKAKVVSVEENGAGSYVAHVVPIDDDVKALFNVGEKIFLNLDWCREVVKRGKGINNFAFKHREAMFQVYEQNLEMLSSSMFSKKHHSNYCFHTLQCMVNFAFSCLDLEHGNGQHVYDVDKAIALFSKHSAIKSELLKGNQYIGLRRFVINKKKFKNIAKAILVKCKMPMRVKQEQINSLYDKSEREEIGSFEHHLPLDSMLVERL